MRNQIIAVFIVFTAGLALCGTSSAQQAPASNSQQPSSSAPQKPSAAKPATSTTAKKPVATAPALTTDRDKESYALGMNIAKGLKAQSVDTEVDTPLLLRGLKDTMSGAKTQLTDDEAKDALTKLQTDVRQKQEEARKEQSEKNLKEGEAFLASNQGKEGVVVLPSGLQYKILTQGTGPKPAATDTVVCQYRGTLIDGTEFDSSYKRGQAATFPLSRVIKGWTEALQLMPVGSKWQLVIPPNLAYGDRGAPGSPIGPNAVLIFEIELMSIRPPVSTPIPSANPNPNANPGAAPNTNANPGASPSAVPHPTLDK